MAQRRRFYAPGRSTRRNVTGANSNGSVRRLIIFGMRSCVNGSPQTARVPSQRSRKIIFQLSKRTASRVAVVREVEEAPARTVLRGARQVRQEVEAVEVHLERLAGRLVPLQQLLLDAVVARRGDQRRQPVQVADDLVGDR